LPDRRLFDQHGVSFVSVTQAFNTTTSMGRLTLNVLLSLPVERKVTASASGQDRRLQEEGNSGWEASSRSAIANGAAS